MPILSPQSVYLPFANSRWRLMLSLEPLDLQKWIEIDEECRSYLAYKADLLQQHHSKVVAALPDSFTAQKEVLELLVNHLVERFPQYYQSEGQWIRNLISQEVWNRSDFDATPLDLAGRLVQEDLCLLHSSPEGYVLSAGSVCLPFHWWFPDKLGKPVARIHQAVPGYAEKLEHHVNTYFDRLQVHRPGWRLNWAIVDTPDLCMPNVSSLPPSACSMTLDTIASMLWIRVERQTLRRIEQSQSILFTIRTYVYPLSILENVPLMARNLLQIIQQMPLIVQQYRNLSTIREVLFDYLNHVSQVSQPDSACSPFSS